MSFRSLDVEPPSPAPASVGWLPLWLLAALLLQGNMDPGVLFGSKATIEQRIIDIVRKAQGTRHIMNLGHGVLVGTPEDNVAHFFEVARSVHERL